MSGEILVTREADTATVTLSNPPKLNALTVAMWRDLAVAMYRLSDDDRLRCVVLRMCTCSGVPARMLASID